MAAGELLLGIILAACGGAALALAMVTQRYALAYPSSKVPFLRFQLPRNAVWFVGLIIYGAANGLYAAAQLFGPLSLLGGIFTTLLIFNMIFARLFLGEELTKPRVGGAMIILVGVVLCIAATPANVETEFTPEDIMQLIARPAGAVYITFLLMLVVASVIAISWYEAKYPRTETAPAESYEQDAVLSHTSSESTLVLEFSNHGREASGNADTTQDPEAAQPAAAGARTAPAPPAWLDNIMGLLYPASLGIDEGIAHLSMKASVAQLATCAEDSQCRQPVVGLSVAVWALASLATLWWLRRVFSRYETSLALPIEYGTVNLVSACSGLVFFREARFMHAWQFALMLCGVAIVLFGIAAGRCRPGPSSSRPPSPAHRNKVSCNGSHAPCNAAAIALATPLDPDAQGPPTLEHEEPRKVALEDQEPRKGGVEAWGAAAVWGGRGEPVATVAVVPASGMRAPAGDWQLSEPGDSAQP